MIICSFYLTKLLLDNFYYMYCRFSEVPLPIFWVVFLFAFATLSKIAAYVQVYTAQRIEYTGGQMFGMENGQPTRTLLSFMMSSVVGQYEDLVCFLPVVTLDANKLSEHFYKVLEAVTSIGFQAGIISVKLRGFVVLGQLLVNFF